MGDGEMNFGVAVTVSGKGKDDGRGMGWSSVAFYLQRQQ